MLHKPTIDSEICPVPAMLAQLLTAIGSMSACTLWTHNRQQKVLPSVEWLIARVGDCGPVVNWHWAECSACWALCCRRVGRGYGST